MYKVKETEHFKALFWPYGSPFFKNPEVGSRIGLGYFLKV